MKIQIVTPAPRGSRSGNRITATRWSRLLRQLKHHVAVSDQYSGQACDLLIAVHARKSAAAVFKFREHAPHRPVILVLAGTDLYRDIHHSCQAQQALTLADRLVLLQPEGIQELPASLHDKCHVIYQSAAMPRKAVPLKRYFEISVIGHLRSVKDPFRAAVAARRLPTSSRIRVVHLGAALDESMKTRAHAEMERNSRYRWLGEQPTWKARKYLARSRAMVISSKLEGGANVVSDAVVAGVPILASRIEGTVGQLGDNYSGYFAVGDTIALRCLMQRVEEDRSFDRQLRNELKQRAPLFTPRRELEGLRALLDRVTIKH